MGMVMRSNLRVMTPILDVPARDIEGDTLPTFKDAISAFVFNREKTKRDAMTRKCPSRSAVVQTVISKTTAVWEAARLPIISTTRATKILQDRLDSWFFLQDYPKAKRNQAYEKRKEEFITCSEKLFDLCTCKCNYEEDGCSCANKPPEDSRGFLKDQRTTRKMNRNLSLAPPQTQKRPYAESPGSSSSGLTSTSPSPVKRRRVQSEPDQDYVAAVRSDSITTAERNMTPLRNTAAAAARFGVSSTAAAAIASAFAVDCGFVTPTCTNLVVDPSKMRRQQKKVMTEANTAGIRDCGQPVALYFDGRKNDTQVQEDLPGVTKTRHVTKKENHIVLVAEPGSAFIGHVTADGALAADEARAITGGLQSRGIATDSILAAGCDGTSYNTGHNDGVLACLERELGRPLQRLVCMLHLNELPLKRLMKKFDGPTSGPQSWTGPIGQLLHNAENMPVKRFKVIDQMLPDVDRDAISWEQKYLYDICLAVTTGVFPANLAARSPGGMHQARWVTTASRVLRLYAAYSRPPAVLSHLAQFVVKVYARCWFTIKRRPQATQGPHHLHLMVAASRFLPKKWRDVVHESISINGFFAHPENLLIAMVADERKEVRELAVERIVEARRSAPGRRIRSFTVPRINFDAEDYSHLVFWDSVPVTPPPLLAEHSDDDLRAAAAAGPIELPSLPCHTQAVERYVREVTLAADKVVGEERRDGLIRTKVLARKAMPRFKSKANFKPSH